MSALRDLILSAEPLTATADCIVAVTMINTDHSSEAQEYRRRAFQNYRYETTRGAAVANTGVPEHGIQEWFTSTWLDEYQLLSTEAAKMSARLTIDHPENSRSSASLEFAAASIPNTALAASLSCFAASDDVYATIPTSESAVFSLRINVPISEFRIERLLWLNKLLADEFGQTTFATDKQNDVDTEPEVTLIGGCRHLLNQAILSGHINAFVDGYVVDGKAQWVGSMVTSDASHVMALLSLLTQISNRNQVELNVRNAGSVHIHRVKICGDSLDLLRSTLNSDGEFFIGCDTDKIWFATGYDALNVLINRIETLGLPEPSSTVIHLNADLGSVFGELVTLPETTSPSPNPLIAKILQLLHIAQQSCRDNDDSLMVEVRSSGDSINARIQCESAILRVIGTELSRFSRENLK